MRLHALTDAAFAQLGAGRPTPATLAELRRAQFGKHLLLLRALVRAVPDSRYAEMPALERTDPDAFRRAVADPLFGAWAAHELRASSTPRDDPELGRRHSGRFLTADHDKIRLSVRLEDSDDRRGLLGLPPSPPLTEREFARWQRHFDEAWRLLTTRHRPAAEILAGILTCIVPVESDPGAAGISATSADAFGAVALSEPADATSLAVGLLHEAQHNLLNAASYLFDLHTDPHRRGYSPWRDDPRPASGILHGAYAYLAVTRFWHTEHALTGDPLAAFEFARWREAVATSTSTLLTNGTLTAAGTAFVEALHNEVASWPPPESATIPFPTGEETAARNPAAGTAQLSILRLARVANLDHYVRWRLRNLRPNPADVAALVEAWQRGDPPPPVRSELIMDGKRALSHSPRLRAIHHLLRGGTGGATHHSRETRLTAVEAALLRGDHGTVLRAYPEDLVSSILAAEAHHQAEVVAALPHPDPALVIWLAGG